VLCNARAAVAGFAGEGVFDISNSAGKLSVFPIQESMSMFQNNAFTEIQSCIEYLGDK
jgi:hypothetical protein